MKKENTALSLFPVTEVELVYHNKINPDDQPQLLTSNQRYDMLMLTWDQNKSELVGHYAILLLNENMHCLGVSHITTNCLSNNLASPKLILATALKAWAPFFVLAHNSPSGDLKPNNHDIYLTKQLIEGGKPLDIDLLDHMILTPRAYYSFKDEGLMRSCQPSHLLLHDTQLQQRPGT